MSLNEKIQKWTKKASEKERGYEVIFISQGHCVYRDEDYVIHPEYIMIALWDENKTTILYELDKQREQNNDRNIILAIKKKKQAIITVSDLEMLLSVGLEEDKESHRLVVFYRTSNIATIMVFSNESSKATYVEYIIDKSVDMVQDTLSALLHTAEGKKEVLVKEETANARIVEQSNE